MELETKSIGTDYSKELALNNQVEAGLRPCSSEVNKTSLK